MAVPHPGCHAMACLPTLFSTLLVARIPWAAFYRQGWVTVALAVPRPHQHLLRELLAPGGSLCCPGAPCLRKTPYVLRSAAPLKVRLAPEQLHLVTLYVETSQYFFLLSVILGNKSPVLEVDLEIFIISFP